jgi:hypothetical protein
MTPTPSRVSLLLPLSKNTRRKSSWVLIVMFGHLA